MWKTSGQEPTCQNKPSKCSVEHLPTNSVVGWRKRSTIFLFIPCWLGWFGMRWPLFGIFLLYVHALLLSSLNSGSIVISHPKALSHCNRPSKPLCGQSESFAIILFFAKNFQWFAWWVKRALGDVAPSITVNNRCPSSITSSLTQVSTHHYISWCPLLIGIIKVNTNGYFSNWHTPGVLGVSSVMTKEIPFFILLNRLVQNWLSRQKFSLLGRATWLLPFFVGQTLLGSISIRTLPMLFFGFFSLPKCRGIFRI